MTALETTVGCVQVQLSEVHETAAREPTRNWVVDVELRNVTDLPCWFVLPSKLNTRVVTEGTTEKLVLRQQESGARFVQLHGATSFVAVPLGSGQTVRFRQWSLTTWVTASPVLWFVAATDIVIGTQSLQSIVDAELHPPDPAPSGTAVLATAVRPSEAFALQCATEGSLPIADRP